MTPSFVGIDPGQKGGFALLDRRGNILRTEIMPLNAEGRVDFLKVQEFLNECDSDTNVFLERAMAFKMGVTGAFNYGRDFAALELAAYSSNKALTLVHPAKWTRVMHEGTNAKLDPKVKSALAFQRLFPRFQHMVPRSPRAKKLHDGIIDAILIAEYGRRSTGWGF